MESETVSTRSAAAALDIGMTKLFSLLASRELVRVKCGRKTLITVESIRAYVKSNQVQG